MAWWYLIAAGLLEIVWAAALKHTDGFTRLWPSALAVSTAAASFFLLALALSTPPTATGLLLLSSAIQPRQRRRPLCLCHSTHEPCFGPASACPCPWSPRASRCLARLLPMARRAMQAVRAWLTSAWWLVSSSTASHLTSKAFSSSPSTWAARWAAPRS